MPASLVTDWTQVRATAIATGNLAEAARLHGVTHAATRQRASRERWPVGQRALTAVKQAVAHANAIQAAARRTERGVTVVTPEPVTASQALERHMTETRDEFRTHTATALRNASRAASRLADDDALEQARRLADLVSAGTKLHGIATAETQIAVQVLNQW